jgi:hypothetical protein
MDCDGVIGETDVDNNDWVYSSCWHQSDNEGALGFSDQGAAKAGPSMHEPVPSPCCHMTIQIREIAPQKLLF